MSKEATRVKQDQNTLEEQKPKKYNDGRNWIGNIVKNLTPKQTPDEYWADVRKTLDPEFLPLFDATTSMYVKSILKETTGVLPEYRFQINMPYFNKMTEKDFQSLKQITDNIKIRGADAKEILKAILYKKEIEHYKMDFKFSEQSIKDIFNDNWESPFYTLYLIE